MFLGCPKVAYIHVLWSVVDSCLSVSVATMPHLLMFKLSTRSPENSPYTSRSLSLVLINPVGTDGKNIMTDA